MSDAEMSDMFGGGYGIILKRINYYQVRLFKEELQGVFFEWYHTTGSLVLCEDKLYRGLKKISDPEEVAIFINKFVNKKYEY